MCSRCNYRQLERRSIRIDMLHLEFNQIIAEFSLYHESTLGRLSFVQGAAAEADAHVHPRIPPSSAFGN